MLGENVDWFLVDAYFLTNKIHTSIWLPTSSMFSGTGFNGTPGIVNNNKGNYIYISIQNILRLRTNKNMLFVPLTLVPKNIYNIKDDKVKILRYEQSKQH